MPKTVRDAIENAKLLILAAEGDDFDDEATPAGEVEPTAMRLMDLAVFFAVIDVLGTESGELDPVARQLAVRHLDEFAANVDKFLDPLMDLPGLKALRRGPGGWTRLKDPSKRRDADHVMRGRFVTALLNKLSARPQLLADTLGQGLVLQAAKRLGGTVECETPADKLSEIAAIKLSGAKTRTRNYVKTALKAHGIEVSDFDETVGDVVAAQGLGAQLRATEARLSSTADPEEAELLRQQATAIRLDVESLAASSPSPAAVISTAATEAAKVGFATDTGRDQGLSPDQEAAMMVRGKAIIAAGAGSGKTRTLAAKVAYHVNELGVSPAQIIATSFSKKSADELVAKVERASGRGKELFAEPGSKDGFGTTHSISFRMCRRHLAGGSRMQVLDNDAMLLKMAMAQVTLRASEPPSPPTPIGFFDTMTQTARAAPDPEPEEAFDDEASALEETAPAPQQSDDPFRIAVEQARRWWSNEGNTRDLVRRWFIKPPYRSGVLGLLNDIITENIQFSQLSPGQRNWLLGGNGPGAGIFPGAGVRFDPNSVRAAAAEVSAAGGKSPWFRNPANQWFNLGVGEKAWSDKKNFPRPVGPKQIALFITNMKGRLVTPSQAFATGQHNPMFVAAYGAYEWLKANDVDYADKMTFDDMLIRASAALISDPALLAQYRARYKVILVDEAQDLNPAQHLFFGLLAGYRDPATQKPYVDAAGQPTGQMTADTFAFIGDDKQAIYAFRGATPDEFIDLSLVQNFDTKLLKVNYRSGGVIVDSANKLIAHNTKQIPMVCEPQERKRNEGLTEFVKVPNNKEGGIAVAQAIKEQVTSEAFAYKDFGIGCRTNAEIYDYVAECLKNQIPFKVPPGKFNIFSNKFSKAIIQWMQFIAADSTDRTTLNKLILELHRAPNFQLQDVFNTRLANLARGRDYLSFLSNGGWNQIYNDEWRNKNVREYVEALTFARNLMGSRPSEIVQAVLHDIKGVVNQDGKWVKQSMVEDAIYKAKRDPEIIDMLIDESSPGTIEEKVARITDEQIRDLSTAQAGPVIGLFEGYEDLDSAMSYLEELMNAQKKLHKDDIGEGREADAVAIDTIHGWKGLECKRMFVPMTSGTFPHSMAEQEGSLPDERRLAYVAITRAQEHLTVICCDVGMDGKAAGPSAFVSEACIPQRGGEAPAEETPAPTTASAISALFSDAEIMQIMQQHELDQQDVMDLFTEGEVEQMWDVNAHINTAKTASDFASLILTRIGQRG